MSRVLSQSAVFALSAAAILLLWTLLTFELPRPPVTADWTARALAQAALLGAVVCAAFAGSAAGFRLRAPLGTLRRKSAVALGFIFAILAFVALPWLLLPGGFVTPVVGAGVIAALVAYVGGRALTVRD